MDDSWTEGAIFCGPGCGKLYQDADGCSGCEVAGVVGLICAIHAWREWCRYVLRRDRIGVLATMLEWGALTAPQTIALLRHPDLAR